MRIDEDIKACIFDMDGTLIDSMGVWHDIDIAFADRFGFELHEGYKEEIQGLTFYDTAVYYKKTYGLDLSIDEILKIWDDMAYDFYTKNIVFKDGAIKLLTDLRKRGIKIGIVTSNSSRLTYGFLNANDAVSLFDVICTSDDIPVSKPSPDGYLYAAKKLYVEPKLCMVFEDVPNGVLAGINAGMRTCAVYDRYTDELDDKKRSLADYYIASYDEVAR